MQGIATRKNELVLQELAEHGVEVYPGSVDYLRAVKDAGLATAVVTASANGEQVIAAAGFADLIDVRVDGVVAAREGLRGKPQPDTFLAGARAARVPSRPRPSSSRTRSPGSPPGGPGTSATSSGSTGSGTPTSWPRTAPTSSSRTCPSCWGDGMTEGRATFPIEPWSLTEVGLDHASLAVHESVFALANGHIGMRGSFEEGEPVVVPGTYLNGFFEERPLPYAEAGYGFPEQGQTMVNVTDGKLIRLLVKDSPLDLDYGEIIDHRRTLDLRAGVLRRSTEWRSPGGRTVRVTSTRLVSLARRSIAAIEYKVELTDDQGDLYVALQSDLLANEVTPSEERRPAGRGRAGPAAAVGARPSAADGGRCSCTGPSAASCGWPRAWTTSSRSPTAAPRTSRPPATWPGTRWPPASRPADRCGW